MLLSLELFFVVLGIVFVWLAALSFFLYSSVSHYRRLTAGTKKEDLASVLDKILEEEKVTEKRLEELVKRIEEEVKDGKFHIQKVGLVRFNPFSDTGGSHSFALAILDGNDSGVIISSLHSRDQTRIYTKQIKNGKSLGVELSKEEQESIEKARKR